MKHRPFYTRFGAFLLLAVLLLSAYSCVHAEYNADDETEAVTNDDIPVSAGENRKRIAITFDDGPDYQGITCLLVNEFAKYGGRATFFVVGNRIQENRGSSDITADGEVMSCGEALGYAASHGWEVGIHGFTHEKYFDICSDEEFRNEIRNTGERIEKYTGVPVTLLRAPGGRIHADRANEVGLSVINWNVDSEDWKYGGRGDPDIIEQNIEQIVQNVVSAAEDGSIVLLHSIRWNSYEATCRILARLYEEGYEFVTVTELIGKDAIRPGRLYYSVSEYQDSY